MAKVIEVPEPTGYPHNTRNDPFDELNGSFRDFGGGLSEPGNDPFDTWNGICWLLCVPLGR